MKISNTYPPNYDAICEVFKIRNNPRVIFTYGDTLYVPGGGDIPDHLMAHEETHTRQQAAMGVEVWWDKYLVDPNFRLNQEVEAYQAQYKVLLANHPRPYRRQVLVGIAKDLAGPIYGHVVDKNQAKKLITGGIA